MSVVSILKVESYDQALVDQAVAKHFEALQIGADIRPGMKVLLKPNLLVGRRPELVVTTHPAVVRAVSNWLRAHGIDDIVLADSPGGPYSVRLLNNTYKGSGLADLREQLTLNQNVESGEVPAAPGSSKCSFHIITPVLEADYIINLPKMKTHGMTRVSLGIKNLFGCIPGLLKPKLHYENPSIEGFSRMLINLAETVKPQLTLIDAIDCMEGNGPSGGDLRYFGILLCSRDLYAQDYVATQLMGIDPMSVGMLTEVIGQGLMDPSNIKIMGDDVKPASPPFRLPDSVNRLDFTSRLPGPLARRVGNFLDRHIRPFPRIVHEKCAGCGKCAESCPQGIIQIVEKSANIDRRKCISCFCCQEMCPLKAIEVERKFNAFNTNPRH